MGSFSGDITDDFDVEKLEWVDGERITQDEYELRIQNELHNQASLFLLNVNSDLNWIFGMDSPD